MITEPMTMITDYMITALALWAGIILLRRPGADRAVRWWAGALLATGVAALAGGTFHGFGPAMPPVVTAVTWRLTMIAIGAAAFCFIAGAAFSILRPGARNAVLVLAVLKLGLYLVLLTRDDDFKYAIYDYTPAMVAVLIMEIYVWLRNRDHGAAWIIGGIVISFAGAVIQQQEIGFHRNFNHNDLYHVVQMVGIYCFYRAGLLMSERR